MQERVVPSQTSRITLLFRQIMTFRQCFGNLLTTDEFSQLDLDYKIVHPLVLLPICLKYAAEFDSSRLGAKPAPEDWVGLGIRPSLSTWTG